MKSLGASRKEYLAPGPIRIFISCCVVTAVGGFLLQKLLVLLTN